MIRIHINKGTGYSHELHQVHVYRIIHGFRICLVNIQRCCWEQPDKQVSSSCVALCADKGETIQLSFLTGMLQDNFHMGSSMSMSEQRGRRD